MHHLKCIQNAYKYQIWCLKGFQYESKKHFKKIILAVKMNII